MENKIHSLAKSTKKTTLFAQMKKICAQILSLMRKDLGQLVKKAKETVRKTWIYLERRSRVFIRALRIYLIKKLYEYLSENSSFSENSSTGESVPMSV